MDLSYEPPEIFRSATDQAHEIVIGEVGSDDFGPKDYLPGLRVLLQSMDYDPHFSVTGRRMAWGMVIGVLRGRAQAIQSMKRTPGFDAHPIRSPVVITGVPRTGTTALHRLMAVDRRFQGLQTWLLDSPMPRPPIHTWQDYPQFQKTVATLEAQYAAAPQKRASHYRAAEEVHECCIVLTHDVESRMGLERMEAMADIEEKYDFRSAWNLPLAQYRIDWSTIDKLRNRGFEIGAHGLRHDGRQFRSRADFELLAPKLEGLAYKHQLRGFRSPSTLRLTSARRAGSSR